MEKPWLYHLGEAQCEPASSFLKVSINYRFFIYCKRLSKSKRVATSWSCNSRDVLQKRINPTILIVLFIDVTYWNRIDRVLQILLGYNMTVCVEIDGVGL